MALKSIYQRLKSLYLATTKETKPRGIVPRQEPKEITHEYKHLGNYFYLPLSHLVKGEPLHV